MNEPRSRYKTVDSNEQELVKEIKLLEHKFKVSYYKNLVEGYIISLCMLGFSGWLINDSMHNADNMGIGVGAFIAFASLFIATGVDDRAQYEANRELDES